MIAREHPVHIRYGYRLVYPLNILILDIGSFLLSHTHFKPLNIVFRVQEKVLSATCNLSNVISAMAPNL